jgi:hypothetical protein
MRALSRTTPRARANGMRATPVHLNASIAWLFIIGSGCFVVASVPAFISAVGGWFDGVTYFVGSLFFTSASFCQLLQAQTPQMTDVDAVTQASPARLRVLAWQPRSRAWLAAIIQFPGTLAFNVSTLAALSHNATVAQQQRYVWRPDFVGSILFLVSSVVGILAIGHFWSLQPRSPGWRIAWVNMVGSILFMASALAAFILPSGDAVNVRISVAGTFLGAVAFLVGAALMLPAWRAAVTDTSERREGVPPT